MFADALTPHLQPQHSNHYFMIPGYDDTRDPGETTFVAYRHSKLHDIINICFWDGHCETMNRENVKAVKDAKLADADSTGPVSNRTVNWDKHWELTIQ